MGYIIVSLLYKHISQPHRVIHTTFSLDEWWLATEVDKGISEEVRNFLLESETSREELDLAALNIQRGRDHGVSILI